VLNIFQLFIDAFRPRMPHPREEVNYKQTSLTDHDIFEITRDWLIAWKVPAAFLQFWYSRPVTISDSSVLGEYPAWMDNGTLVVKPEWLSPGLMAHEWAHFSWSFLSEGERVWFESDFLSFNYNNRWIRLLYTLYPYNLKTFIEIHAEVYRYIGQKMPTPLKKYYPGLF
jgi:hypothetical protein